MAKATLPQGKHIYNGLLWEWLIVNINILATYTNVSSCQIHCILTLFQATGQLTKQSICNI